MAVTQLDVRALQLAKGAVATAVRFLLRRAGLSADDAAQARRGGGVRLGIAAGDGRDARDRARRRGRAPSSRRATRRSKAPRARSCRTGFRERLAAVAASHRAGRPRRGSRLPGGVPGRPSTSPSGRPTRRSSPQARGAPPGRASAVASSASATSALRFLERQVVVAGDPGQVVVLGTHRAARPELQADLAERRRRPPTPAARPRTASSARSGRRASRCAARGRPPAPAPSPAGAGR